MFALTAFLVGIAIATCHFVMSLEKEGKISIKHDILEKAQSKHPVHNAEGG